MSETLIGALIGASSALVGVLLTTLVGMWRDHLAAEHERSERRYEGRRSAVTRLLAESDRIERSARQRAFDFVRGGPPMPVDERDGGSKEWARLRDALAEVELLGSADCAAKAQDLVERVEQFAWDAAESPDLPAARRLFVESAQRDLNTKLHSKRRRLPRLTP